jgi:HD superfamily phosphodiesterase
MKELFERLRDLAGPYQDKRDDVGHAAITLAYAEKLVELEQGDEDIVIPAIILHDIGWSQVPTRGSLFDAHLTRPQEHDLRVAHQQESVRLAAGILREAGYPPQLHEEILTIISEHDTRQGFISKNEGLVRDADKLWRFSETGFATDVRRFGRSRREHADRLAAELRSPDYLYSSSAARLAKQELAMRKMGR